MSIQRLFLATLLSAATFGASSAAPPCQPADGKLKIFILSGQSNMAGFGQVKGSPGTMETYVKSNPKDYGHLVNGKGEPVVRNDVWVVDLSYLPDRQRPPRCHGLRRTADGTTPVQRGLALGR